MWLILLSFLTNATYSSTFSLILLYSFVVTIVIHCHPLSFHRFTWFYHWNTGAGIGAASHRGLSRWIYVSLFLGSLGTVDVSCAVQWWWWCHCRHHGLWIEISGEWIGTHNTFDHTGRPVSTIENIHTFSSSLKEWVGSQHVRRSSPVHAATVRTNSGLKLQYIRPYCKTCTSYW